MAKSQQRPSGPAPLSKEGFELIALKAIHELTLRLLSPMPIAEKLRCVPGMREEANKVEEHFRKIVPVLDDIQRKIVTMIDAGFAVKYDRDDSNDGSS